MRLVVGADLGNGDTDGVGLPVPLQPLDRVALDAVAAWNLGGPRGSATRWTTSPVVVAGVGVAARAPRRLTRAGAIEVGQQVASPIAIGGLGFDVWFSEAGGVRTSISARPGRFGAPVTATLEWFAVPRSKEPEVSPQWPDVEDP